MCMFKWCLKLLFNKRQIIELNNFTEVNNFNIFESNNTSHMYIVNFDQKKVQNCTKVLDV